MNRTPCASTAENVTVDPVRADDSRIKCLRPPLSSSPSAVTADSVTAEGSSASGVGSPADTRTRGYATRTEHDCVGVLEVPADVYWGIHTLRALRNFTVGRVRVGDHPELVRGYALVKRACALANEELGLLDADRARLITQSCRDVESGALDDQFPIDALQGGAGTSTNMNVNEVVANRALELGGHARGDYRFIHPNDDVNRSQSTNDTYPTACRLAILDALGPLLQSTRSLARSFHRLADRHADDVTIGRTQLQDAVPMTFGQEFHVFASLLKADARALEGLRPTLETINLGATAVGTGICADVRFRESAVRHLAAITGLALSAAPDPVAAVTDMSAFVTTSSTLKNLAIHLKKAADDLRLLNSGPHAGLDEIDVPARQAGSSIMPGKVNPVIPECVDQCCFMVIGMDATVGMASSEGQLQLNAFEPVVIHQILTAMELLGNAMDMFRERCVDGITVDTERGRRYAEASPSIAAALNPVIGYERSVAIAKEATRSGRTVREVAAELTDLPTDRLDSLLDPLALSRRLGQTCRERAASTTAA